MEDAAEDAVTLVSIIVTTYNRRSYLKGAVLSVLSQDYPEKEVIVVDDGSTDGSIEEVEGLPVTYIHQENRGISSARNTGISSVTGRLHSLSRRGRPLAQGQTFHTDEIDGKGGL